MKLRNFSAIAIAILAFTTATQAAIHRVNNNAGVSAAFSSAQAAHDAATAGDTLLIEASGTTYGTLNISTQVYVFGPGYFLAENPETQASTSPATFGTIDIAATAGGTVLSGLTVTTNIQVGADNVIIKRNHLNLTASSGVDVEGRANTIISQNYITANYNGIYVDATSTNIVITNNYIIQTQTGAGYFALNMVDVSTSATVSNNVFGSKIQLYNADFKNNIQVTGTVAGSSNTFNNNIGDATQFALVNGNQQNVVMTSVFVGLATGTTDGQWALAAGSPAINAGQGGSTDCGMFGGADTYILSGMPEIPAIHFYSAPNSGSTTNGLPVHIKIKAHN